MRALVQRVRSASVTVSRPAEPDAAALQELTGAIGAGLCVLVGVTHDDDPASAASVASKVWHLRVFDDVDGVMNRSLADLASDGYPAEVLVVSQFTLYGDTRKGRRPGWTRAAPGPVAEPLVDAVAEGLRSRGLEVATGRFGAMMDIDIHADGPVTILLEL